MKRHKPMARSSKPMDRGQGFQRKPGDLDGALKSYHGFKPRQQPLARGTATLDRSKAMRRVGKQGKARRSSTKAAVDGYFKAHGWDDSTTAPCQACGLPMHRAWCDPHHKTPRSELRKAGAKDLDAAHRLLIVHPECHKRIHAGQTGRPKGEQQAVDFKLVEDDNANAANGKQLTRIP